MIRPVKCLEGHKAEVVRLESLANIPLRYTYRCVEFGCWFGPVRYTRAAAVRAWNRAMARKKKGGGE